MARRGAPDPKEPVAVFGLTDRSTLKAAIAWRPRVAPQSQKLPFDGSTTPDAGRHRMPAE